MDVTWSVRMPEELKEKLSDMINSSGLNSKDFITQIIQAYEMKSAKTMQPIMNADIEELSSLTGRLHNLFINLCERITEFQKQQDSEFASKIAEKNEMLLVFNEKIKNLEEKLDLSEHKSSELKNQYIELQKNHSQISEMCESHKALILEYKEKNDTLTGLLGDYKNYKSTIESLEGQLDTQKQIASATLSHLKEKELEIINLQNVLEQNKTSAEVLLYQKMEIANIEKDKAIIALKKDFHEKIDAQQQQYADKTKELLGIIEKMQTPLTKGRISRQTNNDK